MSKKTTERVVVIVVVVGLVAIFQYRPRLDRGHSLASQKTQQNATLAQFNSAGQSSTHHSLSLTEARKRVHTTLTNKIGGDNPAEQPPPGVLKLVKYPAPVGACAAYITPNAQDQQKHPAIVWVFGGFSDGIGATAWEEQDPANDQSGSAFRKAGMVEMYPSFRGGNDNPGTREAFLGEVDDLLAAFDFLSHQPGVDPKRIYLGGHSTGGTMAMLAAESSDQFRGVFSFGPVANVAVYGQDVLPYNTRNRIETLVRSPAFWMDDVKDPTFVLFGTKQPTNIDSIQLMARACKNPEIHFLQVQGATHFSILAPITKLLAQKILADTGPTCSISITEDELNKTFSQSAGAQP